MMSQVSQIQSQSQSRFCQGMSLSQSQPNQSSLEDNLMTQQRFGSQERDTSSKRGSSLASVLPARDESQLQLARTSSTITKRWTTTSASDHRYQVSKDLENRFRQIEGYLNRLGMTLYSVQNDVIQVKKAVKEVSAETECLRQKIVLDSSIGLIKEDILKAFLDANLKSISEQIMNSNGSKLVLPKQIESQLVKFQHEVCPVVTERIEVLATGVKSFNGSYQDPTQSPKNKCCTATRESQKNYTSMYSIMDTAARQPQNQIPIHTRRIPLPKTQAEIPMALKPRLTGSNHTVTFRKEVPLAHKMKDFIVIIDSDEESDGGVSCLLVEKETGKVSNLEEEAKEATLRILREARKRKRNQDKCVILD